MHKQLYSISTGCISAHLQLDDPQSTRQLVSSLTPPGLEVMLFRRWHDRLDEAAALFSALNVPVRTVHGEKRIGGCFGHADEAERARGRENFRKAVDFAAAVGAPYVNIHLWDLPDSDANLKRNIETYLQVSDYAAEREIAILFEVVPCRHHRPIDNMAAVVESLGETAQFTVDLEFLAWHDAVQTQLPAIVSRFGRQIRNLHVRDYDGHPFTEEQRRRYVRPGQGSIPYDEVVRILSQVPVPRIITLEAAYRGDGWRRALQHDLNFVRRQFGPLSDPHALEA